MPKRSSSSTACEEVIAALQQCTKSKAKKQQYSRDENEAPEINEYQKHMKEHIAKAKTALGFKTRDELKAEGITEAQQIRDWDTRVLQSDKDLIDSYLAKKAANMTATEKQKEQEKLTAKREKVQQAIAKWNKALASTTRVLSDAQVAALHAKIRLAQEKLDAIPELYEPPTRRPYGPVNWNDCWYLAMATYNSKISKVRVEENTAQDGGELLLEMGPLVERMLRNGNNEVAFNDTVLLYDRPMSVATILNKLREKKYKTRLQVVDDVQLMVSNALLNYTGEVIVDAWKDFSSAVQQLDPVVPKPAPAPRRKRVVRDEESENEEGPAPIPKRKRPTTTKKPTAPKTKKTPSKKKAPAAAAAGASSRPSGRRLSFDPNADTTGEGGYDFDQLDLDMTGTEHVLDGGAPAYKPTGSLRYSFPSDVGDANIGSSSDVYDNNQSTGIAELDYELGIVPRQGGGHSGGHSHTWRHELMNNYKDTRRR